MPLKSWLLILTSFHTEPATPGQTFSNLQAEPSFNASLATAAHLVRNPDYARQTSCIISHSSILVGISMSCIFSMPCFPDAGNVSPMTTGNSITYFARCAIRTCLVHLQLRDTIPVE